MTTTQETDTVEDAELLEDELNSVNEAPVEAGEGEVSEEWENPILVLQLLQVEDRNFFRRIKETQERLDDARDGLNSVIEDVFNLHPGFFGFVRRALFGARVPAVYAHLIESYNEKIAALEKHRDQLAEVLERARLLASEAENAADEQNTMIFRQRALRELTRKFDLEFLEAAERRVAMFHALLEEESAPEEAIEEAHADSEAPEKRVLGPLTGHFEEFKTKKAEELRGKLLETDLGKKGFRKLQELADRLDQKREERYAHLLNSGDCQK